MKILRRVSLIDDGIFSKTKEFTRIIRDIETGVSAIKYPEGSDSFFLYDKKQGNGVKPIKNAFIDMLTDLGWKDEKCVENKSMRSRKIDTSLRLPNNKFFGVEWETGNISSSHRAINRLKLGVLEGDLEGGILVLPSRKMYYYLTDRIGNFQELEPYFPVMSDSAEKKGYIGIIEIEHDGVGKDIPPIKKGTDGRALI